MLITRASEYALLSLVILTRTDTPIDVLSLSKRLGISKSFLAKVLQSLARENIVKSFKGASGGFILESAPEEISLLSVLKAAEGRSLNVFDCSSDSNDCPSDQAMSCHIWPFMNKLQGKIDDFLIDLTLKDIM